MGRVLTFFDNIFGEGVYSGYNISIDGSPSFSSLEAIVANNSMSGEGRVNTL